jgi:hypothetical protein
LNRRRAATLAATAIANSVIRSNEPPPDLGGAVIFTDEVAVTAVLATEVAVTVTVDALGTLEGAV